MRSVDVPQVSSLVSVRELLLPLRERPRTPDELESLCGVDARHVQYRLHAARVFGWVVIHHEEAALTAAGTRLLETRPGSAQEGVRYAEAFRTSDLLARLDPALCTPEPPTEEHLALRIQEEAGLREATALRRAHDLLSLHAEAFRRDSAPRDVPPPAPVPAPVPVGTTLRIARIEASNLGPLKAVAVEVGEHAVLHGPTGAGKSTLLDVPMLVADLLDVGVKDALRKRATRFDDLLHGKQGVSFDLAVEVDLRAMNERPAKQDRARYELRIGRVDGASRVLVEQLWLKPEGPADVVIQDAPPKGWKKLLGSTDKGVVLTEGGAKAAVTPAPGRLALASVPPDRDRLPICTRVYGLLAGVRRLALRPDEIARPCAPMVGTELEPSGGNLPRVLRRIEESDPARFMRWLTAVQAAIPEVAGVRVLERESDGHLYVKVRNPAGLELPSWRVSEGTLRLLAFSVVAFSATDDAVWLVEEPENGLDADLLQVARALLSGTEFQTILASHAPALAPGAVALRRVDGATVTG